MEDGLSHSPVDPPRGILQARVDDKGRLKLPTKFQAYLSILKEPVFVTSLDGRLGRVYPMSQWKATEKFLSQPGPNSAAAEHALFMAMDYGDETEMDGQGRVLVPTNMRRDLGMENQPVWLQWYRGHITLYSQATIDEKRREAKANITAEVAALDMQGLP